MDIEEAYQKEIEAWKTKHNKWLIALDILTFAITFLLLIPTWIALTENNGIITKAFVVLGSITLILLTIASLNILTDTLYNKIAKHQTHKKIIKQQTTWIAQYSTYHEATEGRKPTEQEATQALITWYENKPTQNS